jgi:hypothetical protein
MKPIEKIYNRFTVIKEVESKIHPSGRKSRMILCKCECGNERIVNLYDLRAGNSKSCGCFMKEKISKMKKTHGDGMKHSEYYYLHRTFNDIKQRCYNINAQNYKYYGGRGIKMFELWIEDYELFKDWILKNIGDRPQGYSIDRIDFDGNYEPGNLRWADKKLQAINRRSTKFEEV